MKVDELRTILFNYNYRYNKIIILIKKQVVPKMINQYEKKNELKILCKYE